RPRRRAVRRAHAIGERRLVKAPDLLALPRAGADLRAAEIGPCAARLHAPAHDLILDEIIGPPLPRLACSPAPEGRAAAGIGEAQERGERTPVLPHHIDPRLVAKGIE